jgi:hypothetical protein
MFGILTAEMSRCPGRTARSMGAQVLARECHPRLRRTWPAHVDLPAMEPPKGSPCPAQLVNWIISGDFD